MSGFILLAHHLTIRDPSSYLPLGYKQFRLESISLMPLQLLQEGWAIWRRRSDTESLILAEFVSLMVLFSL